MNIFHLSVQNILLKEEIYGNFKTFISDEKMTERDQANLKDTQNSFLCMSSVEAITLRCAQRGVFSEDSAKLIIQCLEQYSLRHAKGNWLSLSKHA